MSYANFQLDPLEGRSLLSAAVAVAYAPPLVLNWPAQTQIPWPHAPGVSSKPAVSATPLVGTASGTYQIKSGSAKSSICSFAGSATVADLGTFQATGSAQILTDGAVAQPAWSLLLNGSRGTLTLKLTSPGQHGPLAPSGTANWTVVTSTGAYAGVSGAGTLNVTLKPHAGWDPTHRGLFSISFQGSVLLPG